MSMVTTQQERRRFLIEYLLAERDDGAQISIPGGEREQRELLRALMNVRPPMEATSEFMEVQDAYLKERLLERGGIHGLEEAEWVAGEPRLGLWRGDITLFSADAIVNAANSQMLGCFVPGHTCIDNAIHTFAGIGLRLECARIMEAQGTEEPTGAAKLTGAYNLPAGRVIHTVGPIVYGPAPTTRDEFLLRSCYRSCLSVADEAGLGSVAFCCISTGVFRYPQDLAAHVAVEAVRSYLEDTGSAIRIVFDVFGARDEALYRAELGL